ncbi:MAG TPA: hypothetical protein VL326_27015 [Kofleriaceae bacterium]|nr:hypothetical protein [Kofleriaceae bacterium]
MSNDAKQASKALAKDVARELSAQRRRRKLATYSVFGVLLAAAIMFVRCGSGWGLGGTGNGDGDGKGKGSGTSTAKGSAAQRCTVRVSAEGIAVDGVKKSRDEAVKLCKKTEGAMVTVTGDARQGDWDELRAALQAVGVKIYIRGELWDGSAAPSGSGAL